VPRHVLGPSYCCDLDAAHEAEITRMDDACSFGRSPMAPLRIWPPPAVSAVLPSVPAAVRPDVPVDPDEPATPPVPDVAPLEDVPPAAVVPVLSPLLLPAPPDDEPELPDDSRAFASTNCASLLPEPRDAPDEVAPLPAPVPVPLPVPLPLVPAPAALPLPVVVPVADICIKQPDAVTLPPVSRPLCRASPAPLCA
jgi:hypothetical protein